MTYEDSRHFGMQSLELEKAVHILVDILRQLEKSDRKLLVIIRKLETLGDIDSPDGEQRTAINKVLEANKLELP